MHKKLALVCAKESTVSVQRDERNGFFCLCLYRILSGLRVWHKDASSSKSTRGKKLFHYSMRVLTLASCCSVSKLWLCNKAYELSQCWLCRMCEREYTQRFNCSHTRVRYSIVTQFASVLVCYCEMKSASIQIKLPLLLVSVFWSLYVSQLTSWDCFRYRETIIYWLGCGFTRYVTRTSFIASANPFWKWV